MEDLLVARDVTKDYGAVRALRGVDLDVRRGEVHGLLGANGAGKSTLVKILAGIQRATSGHLTLDGHPFTGSSIRGSLGAGVRVAHQELAVVPGLTVRQNLMLGRRLDPELEAPARRARAFDELFEEWGLKIPMQTPMRDLSPALQATVSLSRSLVGSADLLVLDEPTASLGPLEVEGLFRIVRRRVAEGAGVVFVSHRLKEVGELCDAVTVLRNGRRVHHGPISGLDEGELAGLIADGTATQTPSSAATAPRGPVTTRTFDDVRPVLEVSHLRLQVAVADVSFSIRPGEVLGLAGLVGAGRTEVMEALMGLRRVVEGEVLLDGKPHKPRDAARAIRAGVALVPEERAAQALFPQRDLVFNFASSRFRALGRGPGGFWHGGHRYTEAAAASAQELRLKAESLKVPITALSGGNQQKVVLGRVVHDGLRLLLLDEPTRGVDVGARADFQQVVRRLADAGVAVLYVSSELAELAFCDRIVVMAEGRTTVEAPTGDAFDEDALTRLCFLREAPVPAATAPQEDR